MNGVAAVEMDLGRRNAAQRRAGGYGPAVSLVRIQKAVEDHAEDVTQSVPGE